MIPLEDRRVSVVNNASSRMLVESMRSLRDERETASLFSGVDVKSMVFKGGRI